MNKRPLLIAGGLALLAMAATTAARADQYYWVQPGTPQGQGGMVQSPDGTYVGTEPPQVLAYNSQTQTWQAVPAAPVYSPSDVNHGPQTGRGGLENNEPFPG
jgi:hypothetical protein